MAGADDDALLARLQRMRTPSALLRRAAGQRRSATSGAVDVPGDRHAVAPAKAPRQLFLHGRVVRLRGAEQAWPNAPLAGFVEPHRQLPRRASGAGHGAGLPEADAPLRAARQQACDEAPHARPPVELRQPLRLCRGQLRPRADLGRWEQPVEAPVELHQQTQIAPHAARAHDGALVAELEDEEAPTHPRHQAAHPLARGEAPG
mmetsp:Transcript_82904/g.230679  ORF Transcript_82904/g.230679 Transcript_82904/m.230679 type:complete len:204 (+) Transcript_82904:204-815(+)